jgi:phosphoenolpyruvate phosphomutase
LVEIWAGVHDALSARLAAEAGFDRLWLSSFGLSTAELGLPDAGFLTPEAVVGACRRISDVVSLPLVVDAENGYGASTAELLEIADALYDAGAYALCIEDSAGAKRNSLWHEYSRELRPADEMAELLRALAEHAAARGLQAMARTEALVEGLGREEAAARVREYARSGAAPVVVHFRDNVEDALAVSAACRDECALAIIPTRAPELHVSELAASGFGVVVAANVGIRSAALAMRTAYEAVLREGRVASGLASSMTIDEIDAIVGRDSLLPRPPAKA